MSHEYVPEAASGVRWDDPAFAIEWPPAHGSGIISERDRAWPDYERTRGGRQKTRLLQPLRRSHDDRVGQSRPGGDVEQRRAPVAQVEHPQQRPLVVGRLHRAAARPVEAAAPELRLAIGAEVHARSIGLEHLDDLEAGAHRLAERPGRIRSRPSAEVWYPSNPPCGVRIRQPTGRSNPGEQNWRSSPPQGSQSTTRCGAPESRSTSSTARSTSAVAVPAALVRQAALVADARDSQAMLDAIQRLAVLVQPRQRSDRARREHEPVGVPQLSLRKLLGEHRRDRDPREVVVGERRVADVGRDQHLVVARPRRAAARHR